MGAINAMDPYQKDMGLSGAGSSTGIVFIVYNLGQIAAFPFCGLLADGWGRRICIFVGCVLVLVGTAVQGSAHGLQQFVGGRFILGFGASIASAAGPAYTVEVLSFPFRCPSCRSLGLTGESPNILLFYALNRRPLH